MDKSEIETVQRSCTRFISGTGIFSLRQEMLALAEAIPPDMLPDRYGEGEVMRSLETDVAALLGKEDAVFMPSGTMAQQIALRIWSVRRACSNVAFHPTCHLEIHEQKGYEFLHGLHGILVGEATRGITLADLERVSQPLAALLLELPQREIGGWLPEWDDLVVQAEWARQRGIPLHMDGARLWESGPFYGRPYSEIAGLFDSVYVSFYKGLAGMTGAILSGPRDFIADARVWLRRQGGNLFHMYPYVLTARRGLELRLPRMTDYHCKALEIAGALSSIPGIEVTPNPPHAHMMHVYLKGDKERLEQAALDLSRRTGVWLFGSLASTALPGLHKLEISAGDATLQVSADEFRELFQSLLEMAAT